MSDGLVKRAREVLNGVTDGPWEAALERGCHGVIAQSLPQGGANFVAMVGNDTATPEKEPSRFANATFIAAARELVPAMADRIEELEAKLKTSEEIGRASEEDAGQLRAKLAMAVGLVKNSLEEIDALNTLPPDENGHHWRASDLLDQEVMHLRVALAELTARKDGE